MSAVIGLVNQDSHEGFTTGITEPSDLTIHPVALRGGLLLQILLRVLALGGQLVLDNL